MGQEQFKLEALLQQSAYVLSEEQAEHHANIVLSVPYDINTQSRHAEHVCAYIEREKNLRVYNPNKFTKHFCGVDCCLTAYNCKKFPFNPDVRPPKNDDCWQSSYRWHCEFPDRWAHAGKAVVMLCLVEDGKLGAGQITEKQMAESLG